MIVEFWQDRTVSRLEDNSISLVPNFVFWELREPFSRLLELYLMAVKDIQKSVAL